MCYEKYYEISTVNGYFSIPKGIIENNLLDRLIKFLDNNISLRLSWNEAKDSLEDTLLNYENDLELLYNCLREKGHIWIRIIFNSFSPLFIGKFDFVIGNPPWIKWEFLSNDYKKKLGNIYLKLYNLFSFRGQDARHGYAHDDLAIVFTYVTADKYLKPEGKLGFVLKQTIFTKVGAKSQLAGSNTQRFFLCAFKSWWLLILQVNYNICLFIFFYFPILLYLTNNVMT